MDGAGWVELTELASAFSTHFGESITVEEILAVVAADSKQRYAVEGAKVRASQGHSRAVDLELTPVTPPAVLYHGTVERFIPAILVEGLKPQSRQHVHLSATLATAVQVGSRRGEAVILTVDAAAAHAAGIEFYLSANGVWLSLAVPAAYISRS